MWKSRFHLKINCFWAFAAFVRFGVKRNPHTLIQRGHTRAFHGSYVNKHVIAASIRRYKTKAFGLIEKLDCTRLSHSENSCISRPILTGLRATGRIRQKAETTNKD